MLLAGTHYRHCVVCCWAEWWDIGLGPMSLLVVYLVVPSFIINEMTFSNRDKSKTLNLFRRRNTFKSEKFIDWWKLRNTKGASYRMKLNATLLTRIRSEFCYLFAEPNMNESKTICVSDQPTRIWNTHTVFARDAAQLARVQKIQKSVIIPHLFSLCLL